MPLNDSVAVLLSVISEPEMPVMVVPTGTPAPTTVWPTARRPEYVVAVRMLFESEPAVMEAITPVEVSRSVAKSVRPCSASRHCAPLVMPPASAALTDDQHRRVSEKEEMTGVPTWGTMSSRPCAVSFLLTVLAAPAPELMEPPGGEPGTPADESASLRYKLTVKSGAVTWYCTSLQMLLDEIDSALLNSCVDVSG